MTMTKRPYRPEERANNNPNLQPWKCVLCDKFLGFVENKKVVRIKLQDMYVEIEGGKITMPCRSCGKVNVLEDIKLS